MAANKKLLVLPGDGIGEDVVRETVRVLRADAEMFVDGGRFDRM